MNNLMRFSTRNDFRGFEREVDRLFNGFLNPGVDKTRPAVWTPRLDVAESEQAVELYVDLPGVKKDDLNIEFHDNVLTISGERTVEKPDENRTIVRTERRSGPFRRSFRLPRGIDGSAIKADFENGVLTLHLPKEEAVKPRQIKVS
jgi:HSP20 family protein